MSSLEVYRPEMFEDIYSSFLKDDDPQTDRDAWLRFFEHDWDTGRSTKAYVLADGGKIVGILGTLFSQRQVRGIKSWFCNLHSWFVFPEYRGRSLLLIRPLIKEQGLTLTDFSPTREVCEISMRLGFKPLDGQLLIMPSPFAKPSHDKELNVTTDPDDLIETLSPSDQKICSDHQSATWHHSYFSVGGTTCYVVSSRVERHWRPYAYVHYLSNPESFTELHQPIRRELCRQHGVRFMACDARRVAGTRIPQSFHVPTSSRQLYRSVDVQAGDIDTLYSEVALLRLSTFPSIRSLLDRRGKTDK